jgi:hypothetical protein
MSWIYVTLLGSGRRSTGTISKTAHLIRKIQADIHILRCIMRISTLEVPWNKRMTTNNKQIWIWKQAVRVLPWHSSEKTGKHGNSLVRHAGKQAEIRTGYLPNTSLQRYRYTKLIHSHLTICTKHFSIHAVMNLNILKSRRKPSCKSLIYCCPVLSKIKLFCRILTMVY